jgi:hypothetical protein
MKILITESQFKEILEQTKSQVQSIVFEDMCGKKNTFKSDSKEYQTFYYNNINSYKWDGSKFTFDWSKYYKNWSTMSNDQKKQAIENTRKTKCVVGSYKDNPNLISLGVNELKNVVWSNLTFDNIVEIISKLLPYLPPPYGGVGATKSVELAHGISYIVRFQFSKNLSEITSNFVNGIFKLLDIMGFMDTKYLPSFVNDKINKVIGFFSEYFDEFLKTPLGTKIMSTQIPKFLQVAITVLKVWLGDKVENVLKSINEDILRPIMNFIGPYSQELQKILGSTINYLNSISTNFKVVGEFANYIEKKEPNAFT